MDTVSEAHFHIREREKRERNPGQLEVWESAPEKQACFSLFGVRTSLLSKIIEDSKEILFIWVVSIDIYYVRNEITYKIFINLYKNNVNNFLNLE